MGAQDIGLLIASPLNLYGMAKEKLQFSTDLFSCCESKGGGGCCLILRTVYCPCTVLGDINKHVNGPGGFIGACLCGTQCLPCWLAFNVTSLAKMENKEASGANACCKACCPCTVCCFLMQVHRECNIQADKHVGKPTQMEMI